MQWCRDNKAEELLNKLGVRWEFREVAISSLKIDESRQNNARLGQTLNDDTVESYAVSLANGDQFPAIICTPSGFILDGNHRISSAVLNDCLKVMAYVVMNADRAMMDTIVRTCNTTHGLPLTKEHKVIHAAFLHLSTGKTISDAAKVMGLRYNEVKDAVEVQQMRKQLEILGIQSSLLHKSIVLKLKPLIEHPKVLEQTASLIATEKLTVSEADTLIASMTEHRGENPRLQVLTEWRTRIVGRRDKGVQYPNRTKLFRQLTSFSALADGIESLEAIGIRTTEDRREVQRIWRKLKSKFEPMLADARKKGAVRES